MIAPKLINLSLAFFFYLTGTICQDIPKEELAKIEFEYAAIDDRGLLNGEISIDYEFCIPKDDSLAAQVTSIEPEIVIPRLAKGRIGCSKEEWLCIVSTHDPKWKDKLFAFASLPYVKRIVQTHYE